VSERCVGRRVAHSTAEQPNTTPPPPPSLAVDKPTAALSKLLAGMVGEGAVEVADGAYRMPT